MPGKEVLDELEVIAAKGKKLLVDAGAFVVPEYFLCRLAQGNNVIRSSRLKG